MTLQDMKWPFLVGLFLTSLLIVLAWLVQYSLAALRLRGSKSVTKSRRATSWTLPFSLSHQTQAGGLWGSLLKLRFGRDGGTASEAGVKGLLTSLFSFKSFRENWQKAWVQALNEQACRHGSSIQITFDNSLQLPASAIIDSVTCTDQSAHSMVLQCNFAVDTVTFPVTVTQQSPAAVSMATYQITIEPMLAQLQVRLEEVEQQGLLVSWTFSRQPSFFLTVCPRSLQRENKDAEADLDMIGELVEDTLFSTQPAMILNLKTCASSSAFPRDRVLGSVKSPCQSVPTHRLLLRQLRATGLRGGERSGEMCCVVSLDRPANEKRTGFFPRPHGPLASLDWNEELSLDLGPETKQLKLRLQERSSKGEEFLPGHVSLALDVPRRVPTGQHVLSINPGPGLAPIATVTFELLYLEAADLRGDHNVTPLRPSVTPTKKVDVDRTVMPDGTIVTTVTTIQSRLKQERRLGDSPSRSPSKVEVTEKGPTVLSDSLHSRASSSPSPSLDSPLSNGLDPVAETAIRQLTEAASKAARKTPTKRSTLIISGVSKAPISEDDSALSIGYAAAMDAALLSGASSLCVAGQHQDPDETTPSDVSERPSVDDVESETGSTGALETRSLKDHKMGFLRSGTKLLFRRRRRQKDPSLSQSHEDVSSLENNSASGDAGGVKKSGSFSRRLIKRFSFRSSSFRSSNKAKDRASATNGGTGTADC